MLDLLSQPWPWYVAGPLIGLVVPFVYWFGGRKWGISSALQHLCAAALPGRISYFQYDWRRKGSWQLVMALGIVIGGAIGGWLLSSPDYVIAVSEATRADLAQLGVADASGMAPGDFFSFQALLTLPGLVIVLGGGFLVGFGARWANGCTSGHAISGLSTLQLASLVAVGGFFAGGLVAVHVLLPLILRTS